ncbi:MAG: prenyltransferase/squalene oxidase repeat-containing protein [Planctomycetota bacterium]
MAIDRDRQKRRIRQCLSPVSGWLCLFLTIQFGLSPSAGAAVDATDVSRSIDRGVSYLRKIQNKRGGWDEFAGHSCGLSALCTLALLNAGVPRDDPAVTRAMRYLRSTEANSTYSVSLQTLVFCQYGSAGDLPRIRNNVKLLGQWQLGNGVWHYGGNQLGNGDQSNSQFAVLALGAAQDRGVQVDSAVFERAIQYWSNDQNRDGGWGYRGSESTGSMTCAGVASLIIANGRLGNGSSLIENNQIRCCGDDTDQQDPIGRGIDWLAEAFTVEDNPGGHAGT